MSGVHSTISIEGSQSTNRENYSIHEEDDCRTDTLIERENFESFDDDSNHNGESFVNGIL